jgi:hypothetical protein
MSAVLQVKVHIATGGKVPREAFHACARKIMDIAMGSGAPERWRDALEVPPNGLFPTSDSGSDSDRWWPR